MGDIADKPFRRSGKPGSFERKLINLCIRTRGVIHIVALKETKGACKLNGCAGDMRVINGFKWISDPETVRSYSPKRNATKHGRPKCRKI